MSRLESLASLCLGRVCEGSCKTCLVLSLWLSSGVAMSMREAAKPSLLEGVTVSKFEEVSHGMLVLMLPHVSS